MVNALIEYLTVLLEYIDRQIWERQDPATPEFGHITAWYTRVSAILKVLSLHFNTLLIICLQALMTNL